MEADLADVDVSAEPDTPAPTPDPQCSACGKEIRFKTVGPPAIAKMPPYILSNVGCWRCADVHHLRCCAASVPPQGLCTTCSSELYEIRGDRGALGTGKLEIACTMCGERREFKSNPTTSP